MLAKRSLGKVTLRYQVNGGRSRASSTQRVERRRALRARQRRLLPRRRRAGDGHRARRQREGVVHGGGEASDSFTYRVASDSGRRGADRRRRGLHRRLAGLRRADRARTTCRSTRTRWPPTASRSTSTTSTPTAARRRTTSACSSHYDAVVWYTGNDVVTREPGWGPGNASRLAMQELLEVRDFVNEGGRVLYTGQRAGQQYTPGARHAALRPVREQAVPRRSRRSRRAASPCRAPATRRATRSSTGSGRRSPRPGGGLRSGHRRPVRRRRHRRPARRPVVGLQRRRQRPEPGHELVVHRDRRLPDGDRSGGQLPAVRELAGGRVPERARRARSTRTRASRSCGRTAPTRPTSG